MITIIGLLVLILIAGLMFGLFVLLFSLRWYLAVVPIMLLWAYLVGTAVIGSPL